MFSTAQTPSGQKPDAQYRSVIDIVDALSVPWIRPEERNVQKDKSCKEAGEEHEVRLDAAIL